MLYRTKKAKREAMKKIVEILKDKYPDAPCALEYEGDGWKLLVMARLSAQCTDRRVNIVSKTLFDRFPNAAALAEGDIGEIEEIIKPCGLYRMKAKNIKEASADLLTRFDGVVPRDIDTLLTLSGVGRKIANLLVGDLYGMPAVVCDTHCIRICARLGMYPETERDPVKIEYILRELIDLEEGSDFCHRIVILGREICTARSPMCEACPLLELCNYRNKSKK